MMQPSRLFQCRDSQKKTLPGGRSFEVDVKSSTERRLSTPSVQLIRLKARAIVESSLESFHQTTLQVLRDSRRRLLLSQALLRAQSLNAETRAGYRRDSRALRPWNGLREPIPNRGIFHSPRRSSPSTESCKSP